MERYSLVMYKGSRYKVTDYQGDRVELHDPRIGYFIVSRSEVKPVEADSDTVDLAGDPVPPAGEPPTDIWTRSPLAPDTVTLRDHIALCAMKTWMSGNLTRSFTTDELPKVREIASKSAYAWADAMLAARNQPQPDPLAEPEGVFNPLAHEQSK